MIITLLVMNVLEKIDTSKIVHAFQALFLMKMEIATILILMVKNVVQLNTIALIIVVANLVLLIVSNVVGPTLALNVMDLTESFKLVLVNLDMSKFKDNVN